MDQVWQVLQESKKEDLDFTDKMRLRKSAIGYVTGRCDNFDIRVTNWCWIVDTLWFMHEQNLWFGKSIK